MERIYSDRAEVSTHFREIFCSLGYELPLTVNINSDERFGYRSETDEFVCTLIFSEERIQFIGSMDPDYSDMRSCADAMTTAIIAALLYCGEKDVAPDKLAAIEERSRKFIDFLSRFRSRGILSEMLGYSIYAKIGRSEASNDIVLYMEIC